MRRGFTLCALAALLAGAAHAADPPAKPKALDHKALGEASVAVFLARDPNALREALKQNAPASAVAQQTIDTIPLGGSVYVAVLFSGCQAGPSKMCELTALSRIQGPKGKQVETANNQVWTKAPPAAQALQLAEQGLRIKVDKPDPSGLYRITTEVRDVVAKKSVTLNTSFLVTD